MESLEKYIRSNRDSFDEKEPLEGHFERFQQKLETRKPARRVNLFMVAAAAAIAGLILTGTLGILYNNVSISNLKQKDLSYNVISPEFTEIENYYNVQIKEKHHQISTLSKKSSPEVEKEVKKAIYDMDLGYYLLKKELLSNPNQERVVSAMIQQYQFRVDMLDQILNTLTNVATINGK